MNTTRNTRGQYASLRHKAERWAGLALILAVVWWHVHDANKPHEQRVIALRAEVLALQVQQQELEHQAALASNPDLSWYENEMKKQPVVVTAYNTLEGQTDSSPCIAANGENICGSNECLVANNALPFGTKVELEKFGTCRVVDRMNSRYGAERMDVSFDKDYEGARAFGVQHLTFVVQ